ncbi:MAG: 1-(5-phosphoribosyl)-5-[(5-phosphoribosylamino)methylideneamino]imidazole-4-carboxamide isomerase [Desulfobacterales bacterium]|nr:1-(5-phosphoribosyl)-5-[(5-phosphoribosylamino)methylideneamino]imidazole-4-carboxamide isomerase [Desulfobacterales bacterium]
MLVIPAVDIKDGKCVRLLQGRMDSETVFSNEPSDMAIKWASYGAEIIHVVDLDGSVQKKPKNLASIEKIIKSVTVDVHVGGGIRNLDTIEMFLSIGVKRIVIGTEAVKNPSLVKEACKKFEGRIIVGIDAKNGLAAIEGWTHNTDVSAIELAKQFEGFGVWAINFTDIKRDGMKTGPNIEETKHLAESVSIPIVASGGVSTIDDIKNILEIEKYGVIGVITGRAIYDGTLNLDEAVKLVNSKAVSFTQF